MNEGKSQSELLYVCWRGGGESVQSDQDSVVITNSRLSHLKIVLGCVCAVKGSHSRLLHSSVKTAVFTDCLEGSCPLHLLKTAPKQRT